jgi:signal transduction histidine kinase
MFQLTAQLSDRPVALGEHVVRVDGLQVDLPREDEIVVGERGIRVEDALERKPNRVLDEPGLEMCVLDDEELVRPLEELVDRRAHRALDDLDELLGVHARLRADVERAPAALVVCRERDELEDLLDVLAVEAGFQQALARAPAHEALRTGAGVDSGRLDADEPAHSCNRGRCDPDQPDHLLRGQTRDRRRSLDRVPRRNPDLGAQSLLALDDVRSDVLGEHLDEERFPDHDLVDRLFEELREAGHVNALLCRIEVDGALDLGRDLLLASCVADPNRLLDARHARSGKADPHLRERGLEVVIQKSRQIVHEAGYCAVSVVDDSFARFVSLACHDLRTPLATVSGFAHTLRQNEIGQPADRYVEMIQAASGQIADILDDLGQAARIEAGRFAPNVAEADTLELAEAAAGRVGEKASAGGTAAEVRVEREATERGLAALARCALRHGGLEQVELTADGAVIMISPVLENVRPVILGDDLKDLGAAAARRLVEATGGSVELEGERLLVRLPPSE